ncbi:MAG: ribosome biogenesis GTPase YlqF [Mycoplasmatales bacterium]
MKPVQWYPGHMFKAKKEIQERLKVIDLVIEVVDSRVPISSHNKMIAELTKGKQKLIVFSKADYTNRKELEKFVKLYEEMGYATYIANLKDGKNFKKLEAKIIETCDDIIQKFANKGIHKTIRVLITGIPNVGKSTLINYLINKKKVTVGNKPGVTKMQQWIKLSDQIELLDTPGILVPKIENINDGYNLVLCSLIKDEVVNKDDVAVHLIRVLVKRYPKNFAERYSLELAKLQEEELDFEYIYDQIGRKTGALLRGNEVDYTRVTNTVINDFRTQKFGLLILDQHKSDVEIVVEDEKIEDEDKN